MNNKNSMHDTMKQLGIKICPTCGKEYTGYPATSRKDNKTEICPKCGTLEAVEVFLNANLENKEQDNKYCIFEKRICRFADKQGNIFTCKAKNDMEMVCNPINK